jgi:hypothetical protein
MKRASKQGWKRHTPLTAMALIGVIFGVLIGGGGLGSAASTSPSVSDYSQCANGKPGTTPTTACNSGMINGILNANNSQYGEDQVTEQRLVAVFPLAGDHSIDLQYLIRKANNHAYDSLATWNYTETGAGYCDSFNGKTKTACEAATSGTAAIQNIPDDPLVVASPCNASGGSAVTSDHQLDPTTGAPQQVFTMFGATFNGTPTYTGTTSDTSQGLYENIHIPITTAAANATVYFYFGGHLAAGLGSRAWGTGCGASNINGGPYHIKLNAIDVASAGARDNQITAGAIIAQTPSIGTQPSNTGNLTFSEDLNDSVTLGGGATGNVHFYLFDNSTDCNAAGATPTGSSTGLLYSQTVAAVAGAAETDGTGTGSNSVTASGDYYWTVIYDGDGSLNLGTSSVCAEHSSFTAPTLPTVTNTAG